MNQSYAVGSIVVNCLNNDQGRVTRVYAKEVLVENARTGSLEYWLLAFTAFVE